MCSEVETRYSIATLNLRNIVSARLFGRKSINEILHRFRILYRHASERWAVVTSGGYAGNLRAR